jgi:hypothetical protein
VGEPLKRSVGLLDLNFLMITVKELLKREDFFNAAIVRHGFTDYMRDYEIIVAARNGPPNTDIFTSISS